MDNPYANSSSLVLKEVMLESVYRSLLSKNLTTTRTQFNAVLNKDDEGTSAAAAAATAEADEKVTGVPASSSSSGNTNTANVAQGTGIKGAYIIKTTIKTPGELLSDVDAESSLGLTAADALAALFPPTPVNPEASGSPLQYSERNDGGGADESELGYGSGGAEGGESSTGGGSTKTYVSVPRMDHAERMDVINLQERILQLLEEGRAKPVGICPIREKVYDEAFNELTRQVAVLCPERGLLLSELRKEMRETDTTYDLLFDTACQYAVRKAISRDLGRTMLQEMEDLSAEVRTAENRVSELRAKYEGQQKRAVETRAAAQKVHEEEVAFIKKGTAQLTQEIKRLTLQQQQQQQR